MNAVREIMEYSPVFFYGKAGSDKAAILQAITRESDEINEKPCLYTTAEDFLKDLVFLVKNGQKELFELKYRNNSLLIIDDLQFLAGKFWTQEELLRTLKYLQVQDRQVILFADRHPKSILGLNEDLVDSCYGGLILEIKNTLNALNCK